MNTITIPKKLIKNADLIIIPRKEYEKFSEWKEVAKLFKIFVPTDTQKRDFKKAKEDYKQKNYLTLDDLKHQLEIKN